MMQNKNKKIEILRKIDISKNQQLLSSDYLYNFILKFVRTNNKKINVQKNLFIYYLTKNHFKTSS